MAIFLSEESNFKISGVFLTDLVQLAESVEKEDIASIFLLSGKIAQRMKNYDMNKNFLKD